MQSYTPRSGDRREYTAESGVYISTAGSILLSQGSIFSTPGSILLSQGCIFQPQGSILLSQGVYLAIYNCSTLKQNYFCNEVANSPKSSLGEPLPAL